ncbi:AMSH-like ubiquitin thioesterase 3 [Zea mays]|uniref:AMSH-like ubiquitin thioesterase 3 n=1 Tax=Zea mays TaxID=4577 RepID=A0A1D6MST9_MAIZE|nr:AMSH-like ubiquitin thioesterase 3 [Zea mays]
MGRPQPARAGAINIEACARPIAVDHRISLPYYFRIAGSLLRQVETLTSPRSPAWWIDPSFLDPISSPLTYSCLVV